MAHYFAGHCHCILGSSCSNGVMVSRHIHNGGSCFVHRQCSSGTCSQGMCAATNLTKPKKIDEACLWDSECDAGLNCGFPAFVCSSSNSSNVAGGASHVAHAATEVY